MAAPKGPRRALRVPDKLFLVSLVPLGFLAVYLSISLGVKVFYGYGLFDSFGDLLRVLLPVSAPGAALGLLYLLGRLDPVDRLPSPRAVREASPPSAGLLAIPEDSSEPAPLRPEKLLVPAGPRIPAKRFGADGRLTWGGAAMAALAILLAVVEQDSFDSVFGIKLGGLWWRGEYWNRWWFVFYGLLGCGLASMGAGLLAFMVRINRGGD